MESKATGISSDGSVVVGFNEYPGSPRAFRWTSQTGTLELGTPIVNSYSLAYAVSGDGTTIVGEARFPEGEHGFRYRLGTGFSRIGPPLGDGQCAVLGANISGNITVGWATLPSGRTPVRWVGNLGFPLPVSGGDATAVSSAGDVTVGWHYPAGGGVAAFRFAEPASLLDLGDLPGGERIARAFGVSADGKTVVGHSTSLNGYEAFVWTPQTGMYSLSEYLQANGATIPTGWRLENAYAISPDGRVVVGDGTSPANKREAYAATLGAAITGRIFFEGLGRYAFAPTPLVFEFREPGTTTPFLTRSVELGANDTFELRGLPTRAFDLSVKPSHWLRRTVALDTTTNNVFGLALYVTNGDGDGDNEVGIGDYSILSAAYNSAPGDGNWDANADFNGDEAVDIADYAILSQNYGMFGDD